MTEAIALLTRTLDEEAATDEALSEIAESEAYREAA